MRDFISMTGVIIVRACPCTTRVLEELRVLTEGMDGEGVRCTEYTPGEGSDILVVGIVVYGHIPASHVQAIGDKIRELGPYAMEAAKITGIHGCFFVGTEEQVVQAESQDACKRIRHLAPKLEEGDAAAALDAVLRWSKMPAFKEAYFRSFCNACPFCDSADIEAGAIESDGMVAWAAVECSACKHTWQDVWTMIDMTEVRDADGYNVVPGEFAD